MIGRPIVGRPSIAAMYEMYPETWSAEETDTTRAGSDAQDVDRTTAADRPHRRARKEHQVAPRVLRTSLDD